MTKQEIEKEIEALKKVVNGTGHKHGGKLLMEISELMKQLQSK